MISAAKRAVAKLPPIKSLITRLENALVLLDQARREAKETSAALASARETMNDLEREIANLSAPKDEHAKQSFSHWGEDQVISFIFCNIPDGRYLALVAFIRTYFPTQSCFMTKAGQELISIQTPS